MAHHFVDNVHTKSFTPREYQVELLDAAKERNIIVCLGTESGKSFIAMKLIQEMANDTRREFGRRRDGGRGGKCTLFLVEQKKKADKVSLGLRNLTDLTVSNIWHTEPVSSEWSDERWMQELRLHQVLVMSGQMCYTILNRGILSLKYVNLLIMDQCHQAIKGHPYTKIMSDFYQRLPRKQRPRILGLTTPLLLLLGCPAPERERPKEVFHPGCLEARLERLEKNLDCTAETASDIVSLLRYCPRPRELVVEWSLANESDPVGIALSKNIEFELTAAWNYLQDHRYDPMEIYQDAEFAEELSRIPDPKTDPIAVLKDFMHILKTLGPWCADRAALLLLIHLDKLKVKTPYERHFLLLCMITTIMVKIRGICDLTFQEYNECERIYKFSTPKVLRLLEILREFLPPVTATKTDMLPIVKVKDDTRNVKVLQSTNKEDALLKEQKKDGNIIINEIKNELKTNTLQGMFQTSFDSNATVSNQAEQSNSKKEISCQASASHKENELQKETLKDDTQIKESNANYPVPLEIVAKTEPNFCPDFVEGVKKCEKNNFPNSNSDSSFVKNISVTEVDIITNSRNKENLNFTENILCENDNNPYSSVGIATGLTNKESSIWERGGGKGGRRWGRGRGRGGGGRGGGGRGGRGGHSYSNRNGPDFPVSDSLCGIVFVDGRFTAKILYHLLNDLRRSDPQFASLAAQYTVGCSMPAAGDNNSLLDPRETEAEFRKQEEVLKRFRTHECNLLIGPTGWALEDGGLELPRCNLVLRFDHESISTEIVSLPGNFNTVQTLSTDGNKFMEVTHSYVPQNTIESESLCELKLNNCDTVMLFEDNEITKISHNDITESISCKFKVTDSSFHSSKLPSETELFEDVPQVKNSLVGGTGNDSATPSFVDMSEGITTKNLINCVLKNDHDGQACELMCSDTQSCERKEDVSGSEDDNIFIMSEEGYTDTSRKHENDKMGKLGEEVVSRIPVSYHSYARSRARARAPDAHHIIMAAEGEEARRVVDSLAHFMQIEEMLLCRCKNREPPEEEEVEADGVTLQGETYCPASFSSNTTNSKVPRCGDQFIGQQLWNNLCAKDDAKGEKACVTLATAISLVNRYCAKLPSDTFTRLTPLWSLKKGKGAGGDPSYTCALRLPINSPVKQDILGCPMPSKALARRSAALEACKVLHQARELDDDLMPVGKESFRAEVESDEDEEEEEVEEEEEEEEEVEEEEEDEEESVGENINPHEDEAKMDSSAVNISESVKVEKVEKAVNEICLKKENLDEINFNIKLEVSKDIPQITCEEMENAITNEEVGIKDFTLRETIVDCEQIAIEKEKRGILFVKENQETRTCFMEMGSELENPVNGEVGKELILTQYITQSLDSDEKVESEFNNTANGMNNADETVDLVDREVDKNLPISSHLKKIVENGSVKISSFKCCSDISLKSFDQASPCIKNTSNAILSEVIPELPGKLGMLKDRKEIIIPESDAKFIEMKEHKHKARKKQEEEDLEEEGEEEELPIGEGITGNCVFDRPRPGTTKRRQYYYKRTADALTDCRPLPMHPAYLYNIGMKLVCPLPDEQNTRGRRIHPPEDSPRGFGILTLKEIPKICPFPIFTRSGEVQVGLEPCKSAGPGKSWKACNPLHSSVAENLENKFNVLRNGIKGLSLPDPQQILLTEEQLSKALAFLNYTFAGVLRLQRYLMAFDPVASENSYLIVPTMAKKRAAKDGSNEEMREKNLSAELIEVDWEFVDVIYGCKGESKPDPVSEEERKSFEFESSLYHDAVVMPWYRNQDQPQYFYVAEICTHLSPKSSFPGSEYRTFEEYYFKKYAIQICNREQPLLDVDHTSARLNFLTPRYVNRKGVALPTSSEETKRAKRESLEQKQILVPELCSRHPFPASLWRKAVCLPCILYRLNALLLADQLRARVAREIGVGLEKVPKDFDWPPLDFGWSLADVLKKSKETENQNVESKKRVNSGNGGDKIDSNKEEKSSDEEESDAVEGEERKKPKKKGLKRKRRKKKSEEESGEERSDDDNEGDDDDVSEKNEGEDWMEIGTWSNEMAVQMASGMIPPLPDNVTMVEEGGREGWGGAVIATKAHATGERVRYGSPSIWKGSGAPVEVFSGLEHELEGLETTDSSGDDDDDDAPEDEEGVEEAVLIPEEEVEDRGHHPRGKLRIQFKSDYLAEAVEVLDESVDDDCLLQAVTEAGEDEEEVGVIEEEEEESSWFLEDDEMEERQLLDQYVQHFEHAVLNNKKMIESSGMLLHSGEQFSLNTKVGRISLETEQKVKVTPYCLVESLDLVCKDQDKSESYMTNTNTEDGDFMSLDSLSDDEDIFLDVPCENLQVGDCDSEEMRELSPQKTSEGICRVGSSCSSCSSVCSCCSSCSSCSSPFSSLEEDLPEEDMKDVYMTDFGAENFSESLESNPSFSFDAQPPLEGHPGPSPPLLLQALTMSNANDGINLERLETIGDSFLKYAITAYLYCTHHSIHEGKLSHLRSKQVSNVNLYRLGRRKRLGESMIAAKFEPHDNWLPPCYHVPLHLERALIRAGLPPSHWNGAEVPSLASLSPAQIGRVVREKGRRMMMKSLAEQESSLKSPITSRISEGTGLRSIGFEGNLNSTLERGCKIEVPRIGNFGRCDLSSHGGGRSMAWDKEYRNKGYEQSNLCNGTSRVEGVHSKDSMPLTGDCDNRVEELPCFVPYNLVTQQSIPDKSVADCVEALIGAYLIACGPRGALLFMAWLGIRVLPSQKVILNSPKDLLLNEKQERPVGCMLPKETAGHKGELYQVNYGALMAPPPPLALSSCSQTREQDVVKLKEMPRYHCDSLCKHCLRVRRKMDSFSFQSNKHERGSNKKNFGLKVGVISYDTENKRADNEGTSFEVNPAVKKELKALLGGLNEFEKHIGYNFRDRSLLLQALTHASYSPNRLTDCYQRLEFLGDAVLDYLITRHLYEDPRQHSPGALTDLRSALVNNTIFASLAVRHGFHRFFLHLSPGLHSVVERFVRMQASNGHAICEEYYLIEEEECEEAEDVEVPKALGDVFESVAGAIFLDSGMSLDAVWRVYYRMMKAEIEQFSTNVPKSPIRELLEMEPETAKFGKPEKLADGRRVRVTVEVFGKGTFKGIGRNYRIAKCTAAKCALRQLKKRGLLFPRKN